MDLSGDEKDLLLEILFSQNYALELLCCEFVDIENGDKKISIEEYKKFTQLFEKLETGISNIHNSSHISTIKG
nr:antirepressor AbbA [Litchfieldia salsa]